jgi:uncharacterized protein related to proFAR isomerase
MMEENFLFLLQSAKHIKSGNYADDDIDFITELVLTIDNEILIEYNSTSSITSLGNDLEFFNKIVNFLLRYYEETEEYEKCELLQNKLTESTDIKNQKLTENEHN